MRRFATAAVVCWLGTIAQPPAGAQATFKVATWNVRSGMGIRGLKTRHWSHDTLNCTDRTKPLNAWGIGLPQRELQRIRDDTAVIALAVQEAWNCGRPENLNSVLRFKAATRERNGVALLARYGFAGGDISHRIGGGGYDAWMVGGRVCLDPACSATVPIFSTHWGARDQREWPLQAQNVVNFLKAQPRPHVFAGDLNVFKINRWNPKAPCTGNESAARSRAIEIVEHAGYVDAWMSAQNGEGWTGMTNRPDCGTPEGNVYRRIDYIYAMELRALSTRQFARPAPGTDAPSDHVGLIAELAAPVVRTR